MSDPQAPNRPNNVLPFRAPKRTSLSTPSSEMFAEASASDSSPSAQQFLHALLIAIARTQQMHPKLVLKKMAPQVPGLLSLTHIFLSYTHRSPAQHQWAKQCLAETIIRGFKSEGLISCD